MHSFTSIAQAKDTSLAVVAPGIAEALFATALGLAAAIPAVVAYNQISVSLGRSADKASASITTLAKAVARGQSEAERCRVEGSASGDRSPERRVQRRGGRRGLSAHGRDQRHADGRRDACAADHLHGRRAADGAGRAASTCRRRRRPSSPRCASPWWSRWRPMARSTSATSGWSATIWSTG